MASTLSGTVRPAGVVGRSAYPQASAVSRAPHGIHIVARIWQSLVALLIAVALCAGMSLATPSAYADEASPAPSSSSSPSSEKSAAASADESAIVDPNNLLGSHLTEVSDAIANTYRETGVTVRLLFLPSFNTTQEPSEWATKLLDSLDPKPNTVLLAVASNDGNLVTAVSSNSDEWLKDKQTVAQLSDAALDPIVNHKDSQSPNWTQSALDMMTAIDTAHKDAESRKSRPVIVVVVVVIVVLLAAAVVAFIIWRKKHPKKAGRHSGKRAKN